MIRTPRRPPRPAARHPLRGVSDPRAATGAGDKTATSQLALPKSTFDLVDATTGYEASESNASRVSLATDMVFRDGADRETPTMTGSVADGFTAQLNVPV